MSILKVSRLLANSKTFFISPRVVGRYFSSSDDPSKLPDFYSTLGLKPSSTAAEIKKAYFDLTFKFHPDRNKNSVEAATKFREVAQAYEILGDYSLRKRYDKGLPLPLDEMKRKPTERVIVEPQVEYQSFFDSRSQQYQQYGQAKSGFSFKEYDHQDENQMDGKRIPPGFEYAAQQFEESKKQQWVVAVYLMVIYLVCQWWKKKTERHVFLWEKEDN